MVEQGEVVLWDRGMLGIPQESGKSGPIKDRYVIRVLQIIDARDSDYGRDWNIGLYDIVSVSSTKKVEKHGQMLWKGCSLLGKVSYGYCPFCSYASTNHRTTSGCTCASPWPAGCGIAGSTHTALRACGSMLLPTSFRPQSPSLCTRRNRYGYHFYPYLSFELSVHSKLASLVTLKDRIVPATSLEDTQGIYFKQILRPFPFSYCNRKSGKR